MEKQFTTENTTGYDAGTLEKMNAEFDALTADLDPDFDQQEIKHIAEIICDKYC